MELRLTPEAISGYLARAEDMLFEQLRMRGILDTPGASGADVVVLVPDLYHRLLQEFPQFPQAYVTIGDVVPPAHAGDCWTIAFHLNERGVELRHEVIRSTGVPGRNGSGSESSTQYTGAQKSPTASPGRGEN